MEEWKREEKAEGRRMDGGVGERGERRKVEGVSVGNRKKGERPKRS